MKWWVTKEYGELVSIYYDSEKDLIYRSRWELIG